MSQISSINRRAAYTTSFGKAISKRAPPAGLLEARKVPPWAETRAWASESPMPNPAG